MVLVSDIYSVHLEYRRHVVHNQCNTQGMSNSARKYSLHRWTLCNHDDDIERPKLTNSRDSNLIVNQRYIWEQHLGSTIEEEFLVFLTMICWYYIISCSSSLQNTADDDDLQYWGFSMHHDSRYDKTFPTAYPSQHMALSVCQQLLRLSISTNLSTNLYKSWRTSRKDTLQNLFKIIFKKLSIDHKVLLNKTTHRWHR